MTLSKRGCSAKLPVIYAKYVGNNFAGQSPDVPGCVSAADTLEEMRAMMKEALEGHLQVLADYGDKLPEPTGNAVNIQPEDFDDVEYFVVEHIPVEMPSVASRRIREAIPA